MTARWPGRGDARWPAPRRPLPSVRPPEWCFRPPKHPTDADGYLVWDEDWSRLRREHWDRCRAWCDAAGYSALDLLRLRGWRRGQVETRWPDDPPDLFLDADFGIDRDR